MSDHNTDRLSAAEAEAVNIVRDRLAQLGPEGAQRVLEKLVADPGLQTDDRPMYARGIAGPLGKLIHTVKTKIDEVTFDLFLKHCAAKGSDASSVLRDCIYFIVHRRTYRQMVVEKINHEAQCAEGLAKLIGPIGVPEFGGEARHHG